MQIFKTKGLVYAALLMLPIAAFSTGCSSSTNSGSGGQSFPQSIVDLAVGDDGNDNVLLYFDILASDDTNPSGSSTGAVPPSPDVTLDNAGSGIVDPFAMVMTATGNTTGDLYIASRASDDVRIFRDYRSLADGAAPDVVLDFATAAIDDPNDMKMSLAKDLIVANGANNTVGIFRTADAIAANQAPDVSLDNATSLVSNPQALAIAEDATTGGLSDLYVGNANATNTVLIFRDLSSLTSSQAPDAVLNATSFLNSGVGVTSLYVDVTDDLLFVAGDDSNNGAVFVFSDASTLSTSDLPSAVLFGNDAYIDTPYAVLAIPETSTLLVGNANFNVGVCTDAPGLVGFFPDTTLSTGQAADIVIPQDTSNIGSILQRQLHTAGGALFLAGTRANCGNIPPNDVLIFRNSAAAGISGSQSPNIILPGSLNSGFGDIYNVSAIAAVQQDQGT